ncbi:diguanylate cyclase, partial [Mycobacterium tuberculosis]|nr:diguanylate cyclase [Mycobacterium tuberculosis]
SGPHLCGRLGGEEFGVVFAGDKAAVCGFAALLVAAVHAAFHPPHAVSISVGVAGLIKDRDLSESYRCADEALYRAKREGKNRYVLA